MAKVAAARSVSALRAVVADEEREARKRQARWIKKRQILSLIRKLVFQAADLASDVIAPTLFFWGRSTNTATTTAEFLKLSLDALTGVSCVLPVPPGDAFDGNLSFVGNLSCPHGGGALMAEQISERDPEYALPVAFEILYGLHAVAALFLSLYVYKTAVPYLRHTLRPFLGRSQKPAETGKVAAGMMDRVAAARTDDEEDGGAKGLTLSDLGQLFLCSHHS